MEEFVGSRVGGECCLRGNGANLSAICLKGVELELGTRGLRMLAAFWAGISVEVTQETGVDLRSKRAAIGTPF